MLVEIKDNQIVIKISEAESNFLTQKALQAGQKDVCSYVKAQLLEALGLQNFEDKAMRQQTGEFDLTIIRQASAHLNRTRHLTPVNYHPGGNAKSAIDDHNLEKEEPLDIESINIEAEEALETESVNIEPEETPEIVNVEAREDLLDDLLDKDLLEGRVPIRNNVAGDDEANSEVDLNKTPDPAQKSKANNPPGEPKTRKRSPKQG